jgi:hypothetical protein
LRHRSSETGEKLPSACLSCHANRLFTSPSTKRHSQPFASHFNTSSRAPIRLFMLSPPVMGFWLCPHHPAARTAPSPLAARLPALHTAPHHPDG